jgi:hypothetical protein
MVLLKRGKFVGSCDHKINYGNFFNEIFERIHEKLFSHFDD